MTEESEDQSYKNLRYVLQARVGMNVHGRVYTQEELDFDLKTVEFMMDKDKLAELTYMASLGVLH